MQEKTPLKHVLLLIRLVTLLQSQKMIKNLFILGPILK